MTTLAQNREPSLRHPPTLVLKPVLIRRHPQFHLGLAVLHVFTRVEDREVLADDLVGMVPLQ